MRLGRWAEGVRWRRSCGKREQVGRGWQRGPEVGRGWGGQRWGGQSGWFGQRDGLGREGGCGFGALGRGGQVAEELWVEGAGAQPLSPWWNSFIAPI